MDFFLATGFFFFERTEALAIDGVGNFFESYPLLFPVCNDEKLWSGSANSAIIIGKFHTQTIRTAKHLLANIVLSSMLLAGSAFALTAHAQDTTAGQADPCNFWCQVFPLLASSPVEAPASTTAPSPQPEDKQSFLCHNFGICGENPQEPDPEEVPSQKERQEQVVVPPQANEQEWQQQPDRLSSDDRAMMQLLLMQGAVTQSSSNEQQEPDRLSSEDRAMMQLLLMQGAIHGVDSYGATDNL